ncbi:hypothetical protein ACFL6G_06690 [candidate division KSB1 bacterium]
MGLIPLEKLEEIRSVIENSPHKLINVQELADKHDVRVKDLCCSFKYEYKHTVKQYAGMIKLEYLKKLIRKNGKKGGLKMFEYAYDLGFSDSAGLQHFLKKMGGGEILKTLKKRR